jgi:hypothetical protein
MKLRVIPERILIDELIVVIVRQILDIALLANQGLGYRKVDICGLMALENRRKHEIHI